jgi:hypothetical protein
MMPLSLGTLRPWRRIQYLFLKMGGDGDGDGDGDGRLPLETSICPK